MLLAETYKSFKQEKNHKYIFIMIKFEKEVIAFLELPSIPKKEWDGKRSFEKGVAVVKLYGDSEAYAIASFDADSDTKPRIVKVFDTEQFKEINKIYVVPNYMDTDLSDSDLDDESKKRAEQIIEEANAFENEGVEENDIDKLPEWIFDEIHNIDEAEAYLRRYNSVNHIKGGIPTTEENIKLRLYSIYKEQH